MTAIVAIPSNQGSLRRPTPSSYQSNKSSALSPRAQHAFSLSRSPGNSAFHRTIPSTSSSTSPTFTSPAVKSPHFEGSISIPEVSLPKARAGSVTPERSYSRSTKEESISDSVLAAADTLSNMSFFSSHKGSSTSPVKPPKQDFAQSPPPATATASNSLPADLLASIQPPSIPLPPVCEEPEHESSHYGKSSSSAAAYEPHTPYRARARTPDPENMMIAAVEKRRIGSTGGNYSSYHRHNRPAHGPAAAAYAAKRRSVVSAAAGVSHSHHRQQHPQQQQHYHTPRGTSHSPPRYDGPFQIPQFSSSMSHFSTRSPSPARPLGGGMRSCSSYPSFQNIHALPPLPHRYYSSSSSSSGKRSRAESRSSHDGPMEDDHFACCAETEFAEPHARTSYDAQAYTKRRAFAHSSHLPPRERYSSSHHSTDDERRSSTSSSPAAFMHGASHRRPHAYDDAESRSSSSRAHSRSPSYSRSFHSPQHTAASFHPTSHFNNAFPSTDAMRSMRKSASVPEFLFAHGVLPRPTLPGMSPLDSRHRSNSKSPPRTLTSPPHTIAQTNSRSNSNSSHRSMSPDRMSITPSEPMTPSNKRPTLDALSTSMNAAATAAAFQQAALAAAASGAGHRQFAQSLQAAAAASSAAVAAAASSSSTSSGASAAATTNGAIDGSLMSVLATMAAGVCSFCLRLVSPWL